MAYTSGDEFLQEEVDQWTDFLVDRLKGQVQQKDVVDKGVYLRSIAAKAVREAMMSYRTSLMYARQGRFADMGAGWGYHKGKYMLNQDRTERLKGRKGNKVYSRTAYGTLGTLMNNVANKFVANTLELIKSGFPDGQHQN